ncbi:Transmembrane protein 208 [Camellia lanceoleosa]|uniref:Transmembrane protein 208 n=1 Tax=Camellia lanceoleosa TaxID=1840588 RepID=A0ACC0H4W0_9ERIC|nr:Transmembrane protein 208 [Camellia lanceoleosa]
MANQGTQKQNEENSRHLKNLLCFIIFSNGGDLPFYFQVEALGWLHIDFFAYIIPYQQLAMMAKPTYSESGELEDGGFDLTTDGVCGYLHDVIDITSIVQFMTIISEKFWNLKRMKSREKRDREDGEESFKTQICMDKKLIVHF